ncbi:MAG: choice-of-anchor Q domain-containing protein, partial [Pyrinomonadaceae bacterium]
YLSGMKLDHGKSILLDGNFGSGGAIYNGGFLFASDLAIANFNDSSGIQNHSYLELRDSSITGGIGTGLNNETNNANLIDRTVISNNTQVQGAGVVNSGTLTITNSTIELNLAAYLAGGSGSAPLGGGIFNFPGGKLYLDRSAVLNNGAQLGAGLYNLGYAELKNSTFSGNHANLTNNGPTADGGAIYADGNYVGTSNATLDLINVTIAGNSAANSGGGIFMKQIAGSFALQNVVNTIVALNSAPNGTNVYGEVISYGHNLIGNNQALSWAGNSPSLAGNIVGTPGSPVDPKFAPFGNYGGPTPMLVLLPTSPAINAGDPSFFPATDQRGVARPVGGISDIGAYERNVSIDQATLFNGVRNLPYLNGNGAQLSATRLGSFAATTAAVKGAANEMLAPMQFSVAPAGGSLPPGLTLSPGGLLSGTPTASGTFTFVIKAIDTDGAAGVQQYTMTIMVPTAAGVSIYGRVLTPSGLGLTNAQVILTDQLGGVRTLISSSFGAFQFDELVPGRTYLLTVNSKRFHFEPQVIEPVGALTEVELRPAP